MDFYRKVKKDIFVKERDFTPVSLVNAQILSAKSIWCFKCCYSQTYV